MFYTVDVKLQHWYEVPNDTNIETIVEIAIESNNSIKSRMFTYECTEWTSIQANSTT